MTSKEESYISTCCQKEIEWEEYALNHGMCNKCMDEGLKKFLENENTSQKENLDDFLSTSDTRRF